jgi:predicted nucleic acid-binding protein
LVVKEDPEDNRAPECAAAARAEFIVTGDKHLLQLEEYAGIRIMKVADFISCWLQSKA